MFSLSLQKISQHINFPHSWKQKLMRNYTGNEWFLAIMRSSVLLCTV